MLGPVADVHHPAPLKVAVAHIEVPMVTIDRDAAPPELTAVKGEVVVVELKESDTTLAVLKEAVFKGCFREGLAIPGMVFQARRIGEANER